jgi:hypothetical protein
MLDLDFVAALALLGTLQLVLTLGFTARFITSLLKLKQAERLYRLRLAVWTASAANPSSGPR